MSFPLLQSFIVFGICLFPSNLILGVFSTALPDLSITCTDVAAVTEFSAFLTTIIAALAAFVIVCIMLWLAAILFLLVIAFSFCDSVLFFYVFVCIVCDFLPYTSDTM